jgi:hypothetical protein
MAFRTVEGRVRRGRAGVWWKRALTAGATETVTLMIPAPKPTDKPPGAVIPPEDAAASRQVGLRRAGIAALGVGGLGVVGTLVTRSRRFAARRSPPSEASCAPPGAHLLQRASLRDVAAAYRAAKKDVLPGQHLRRGDHRGDQRGRDDDPRQRIVQARVEHQCHLRLR